MMRRIAPFLAMAVAVCLLTMAAATPRVSGQPGRSANDAQIVQDASLVASGEHVEIFQHGVKVDPAFLKVAEDAYRRLEVLTGRPLDIAVP